MIRYKKSRNMNMRFTSNAQVNLMESAYPIYLELNKRYSTSQMLLLESMIAKSAEAKTSIIGVNPVLRVSVINRQVTITANKDLQKQVKHLYSNESFTELGIDETCFH